MVLEIIDELLVLARAQDCVFPADFKQKAMDEMLRPTEANSIMYQDYAAKRPMEVETYLGSPIKLAQGVGLRVPRIETLYAVLHNLNIVNQQKKDVASPVTGVAPPVRLSSVPPPRQMMNSAINGAMNGNGTSRGRGRAPSMNGPPSGMRRGHPPMNGGLLNGYGRPVTGNNGFPPRNQSRRGSLEGNDLEEFSHLVLYDDIPESGEPSYGGDGSGLALRERELLLKQRELALREQELRMRSRGPPGTRRGPSTPSVRHGGFDDEDEDDYYDPADGPPPPMIDPDNFDMMSVTSRRNRKAPSASQFRKNPEYGDAVQARRGGGYTHPGNNRNRSSARIISQFSGVHDSIMDDPLMGYSSNRYGNVDRQQMGRESRTNSLTTARLDELQYNGSPNGQPGPPAPYSRRTSQSPGNPYSPQVGRGNGRPSPPNGYMGPLVSGRPSPPAGGMMQPVPRHPSGQGNSIAPQQVEQYAGVSALHPPKGPVNVRSLTGSASASAGSGESANIDSEPSAHSSQSSLGHRPPIGVR